MRLLPDKEPLQSVRPTPRTGVTQEKSECDQISPGQHLNNMASMWAKYRVTEKQFQELMNAQKGVCLICNADFGLEAKRACVDHDHYTGSVRGLLCTQCNTRIGWLEKNIYRLIPYLQQR